ncbi:hypothetical protein WSK_4237 [Novosphingobium sp. Rr 2-17]|uniref:hypothetical protein n=1 Tax=Novosphingobium sp. Rr 2-17 TaxID=555793 RepID=UPI000269ABC1|nr:hypothetical protein [Novosphingobium sp. Rr 2-17]EIZ77244.1 hypothetical protein WSK_4237 [Novosphingobium sp. Rr 2-17]
MFTQLNPTIPLHVMGKGDGYALGMIDYGQEHNLIWVTALDGSGEIWCAPNHTVRLGRNWTMGRVENPLIAKDKAAERAAAKSGQSFGVTGADDAKAGEANPVCG